MNIKRGAMAYQQFQRKKGKEAFLLFNSDLPTDKGLKRYRKVTVQPPSVSKN